MIEIHDGDSVQVKDGVAKLGDKVFWQDRDWPCYESEEDDPSCGLEYGPITEIYVEPSDGSLSVGIDPEGEQFGPRLLGRLPADECYLSANNM